MSFDDLLTDKKGKTKKKKSPITSVVKKPDLIIENKQKSAKSIKTSIEKPSLLNILGLDPLDFLITYPEFEAWFRGIAPKMPYFKSAVKQANQYGKDSDIKSHYFSFIAYLQHILKNKE